MRRRTLMGGGGAVFEITPTSINNVPASGGTYTIACNFSGGSGNPSVSGIDDYGYYNWNGKNLILTIWSNSKEQQKSFTVTLTYAKITRTILITQEANALLNEYEYIWQPCFLAMPKNVNAVCTNYSYGYYDYLLSYDVDIRLGKFQLWKSGDYKFISWEDYRTVRVDGTLFEENSLPTISIDTRDWRDGQTRAYINPDLKNYSETLFGYNYNRHLFYIIQGWGSNFLGPEYYLSGDIEHSFSASRFLAWGITNKDFISYDMFEYTADWCIKCYIERPSSPPYVGQSINIRFEFDNRDYWYPTYESY